MAEALRSRCRRQALAVPWWSARDPDVARDAASAAADVGYQSEAAFNRAFKKYVGVPPGESRRARLGAAGSPTTA